MPLTAIPLLTPAQTTALVEAYGALPGPQACDGIVPTRSQIHGRVLTAVRADHLDAIGHFDQPAHRPPHVDWLISGSGFRRLQFERTVAHRGGFRPAGDLIHTGLPRPPWSPP